MSTVSQMAPETADGGPTTGDNGALDRAAADGSSHEGARGIARRIDHLGRIVIPSEYRKVFGIEIGDLLDMTIEGDAVAVRRLERSCVFCQSLDDLGMFRGKLVCQGCLVTLRSR
jgi:AbrB family transcriptional regulator, transcriptional pleiotropic regulator of transition state genes